MPFLYKKIVVFGATSGIGKALAERFVAEGSFVIAVGRRKANLESLVHEHGHDRVQAVPFDITQMESIPNLVANITKTHEDVDCVLLNSGIQRKTDFSDPDSIDMNVIHEEFTTNYLSQLALTKAFLPFLQAKQTKSALIYVTSGLALVPITRCSNYCASKAALHQWILCLREQLKKTSINVVELYPPAVQTELHDEKHQPDIKNGGNIGMPLDEFIDKAYAGLASGSEQVAIGMAEKAFDGFERKRQEIFGHMVKAMGGGA